MAEYYTTKELAVALDTAKTVIDNRSASVDYVKQRGYNDCWAFAVAYDVALTGDVRLEKLNLTGYKSSEGFLRQLHDKGHTMKSLAEEFGYEVVRDRKPVQGDIMVTSSGDELSVLIAGKFYWYCANGKRAAPTAKLKQTELIAELVLRPVKGGL